MPMSKPNVPKFVCCIHVSVPNTITYSAMRAAKATAGASSAGRGSVRAVVPRDRRSAALDGSASGGVVVAALGRVRARRNDCANARERMSTAGVYGQDQGQWISGLLLLPPPIPSARRGELRRTRTAYPCSPPSLPPLRTAAAQLGGDELVEVPIQDRLDVARLDPGPVVLDQLVRVQDVRADLVPEGDPAPLPTERRELLLPLQLVKDHRT